MDKQYIKPYISINSAIDNALEYIQKRKDGNIVSLTTRWNKLNNQTMGGVEPNVIWTIVGTSGSGNISYNITY